MKKMMFGAIAASLVLPLQAQASSPVVYGIGHVSIDSESGTGVTDDFKVSSRSSRLGVKGSTTFKNDLQGVYKFEMQLDMTDDNNGDDFIKSRNMYIGLKDKSLGTLLVGRHDTAMKKAIGIKIFSDTVAEMTSVMGKDVGLYNRTNNTLYYASPKFSHLSLLASVSTEEGDAGNKAFASESAALVYKTKQVYAALATEKLTTGSKGNRITFGYTFAPGHKLGAGFESGNYTNGDSHTAYVVNGVYQLNSDYKVKATYGMRKATENETALGLSLERDLGGKSNLYVIYHQNKDDNTSTDKKTISLGMKYVF